MEGSNEAEVVTRAVIEGTVYLIKLSGQGIGKMLTFLAAASAKTDKPSVGKTALTNLLKSGKELKCFTFSEDQIKLFAEEAKRYGMTYSMVKRGPADRDAGTYDVLCKAEDAARLNRILERMGVNQVEVTNVQASETTHENADSRDISDVRELIANMMQPDENQLNPEMAAETGLQSQSAATYQADLPSEIRTSVVENINNINANISGYQPQENANSQLAELINNMLSQSGKDEVSASSGEHKATSPVNKNNENVLSEKPEAPGVNRNAGSGIVSPGAPRAGRRTDNMEDAKDRLMDELEKNYNNMISGLNVKGTERE